MIDATITEIIHEQGDIYTIKFKIAQPLDYTAGQFIELHLPHASADDRGVRRWFTLSSSPTEDELAITTRYPSKPSSYKQMLFALTPGATVQISQAMGDFVLPLQTTIPIIFAVRGIGVTPLRSIAVDVTRNTSPYTIYAVQSGTTKEALAFMTEIERAAKTLITDICAGKDAAKRTSEKIIDLHKKLPGNRIYISGPEQFVEATLQYVTDAGVNPLNVTTDYFHGYRG